MSLDQKSPNETIIELHEGQIAKIDKYKMEGNDLAPFLLLRDLMETWRLVKLVSFPPSNAEGHAVNMGEIAMLDELNLFFRKLLAPVEIVEGEDGQRAVQSTFRESIIPNVPKARP